MRMQMRAIALLLPVLLAAAIPIAGQPTKAAIAGRVVLEGNKLPSGLFIRVQRLDKAGGPDFTETDRVETAADGTFQTKDLPHGRYAICVGAGAQLGLIDPCEWRREAKEVALSQGVGRNEAIRVSTGTRLRFRLQDPNGALRHPRELGGDRPSPLLGVFDDAGFFHMAKVFSVGATEQVWILPVPKGAKYTVHFSVPGRVVDGVAAVSREVDLRGRNDEETQLNLAVGGKR